MDGVSISEDAVTNLEHLPHELLTLILEHLRGDQATLRALSVTSHSFYVATVSILYDELVTDKRDVQRAFLRTVTSSQNLADLVHAWGFEGYEKPAPDLLDLITSGLAAMRNLKRLWFGFDFEESPSLLKGATFQLNTLRWCGGSQSEKEFMFDFLKSHPDLTELHVDLLLWADTSLAAVANAASLPRLTRVSGSHLVLATLLPSCPTITEAIWESYSRDYSTPPINTQFLSSLKQLRKLVFEWPTSWSKVQLLDKAPYFLNLEVLEVYDYFLSKLLLEDAVALMPMLRWVVVHLYEVTDISHMELARALFHSNSNLRYVSVSGRIPNRNTRRMQEYNHFQRNLDVSSVQMTIPVGVCPWYWGLHDQGHLREGWDGQCR
ncbi:hypothetical protein AX16_001615 [Volvariella volvacea WC 439]|nr:hypothetical protein AX16_001615 [Volvariella volvacea WC 439]